MQQTEKYWNLINRFVLVAIVAMASVGIVLAFAPKVREMQENQETRDSLQRRIDQTVQAENELKEKQQRFLNNPSYVEKIAHEVGYAKHGEIIYHFPEETGSF